MKFHMLFLFFFLFFQPLSAGIEKFLKKPTNKSVGHTMKNIDFIYMINLDQRPEKYASCIEQLAPYNISPFRFSAVNGWELPLETLNKLGVKFRPSWMLKKLWGTSYLPKDGGAPRHEVMHVKGQNYFCHCMARGTIGIVLSHLSVLKDAYDSGYNTVWITEDDIQVIQDPHGISDAIEKLDALVGKDGWDILFTDKDSKFRDGRPLSFIGYAKRPNFTVPDIRRHFVRKKIGPNFIKIGSRFGAHSMIIRRSGMKKILDFIDRYKIFAPYDVEYTLPDIEAYTVAEDIVSADPQALSDIRID